MQIRNAAAQQFLAGIDRSEVGGWNDIQVGAVSIHDQNHIWYGLKHRRFLLFALAQRLFGRFLIGHVADDRQHLILTVGHEARLEITFLAAPLQDIFVGLNLASPEGAANLLQTQFCRLAAAHPQVSYP